MDGYAEFFCKMVEPYQADVAPWSNVIVPDSYTNLT